MSGFFLNDIIRKGTAILQLLPSENETLLVGRNPLLVLNLGLHVIDSVERSNFEGDGLAIQGLYEDLHSATKAENEMKGRHLLNIAIR